MFEGGSTMEIVDLTEEFHPTFFVCLEDWSDEIKEAGPHKRAWFEKMRGSGLRVKLAVENGKACGMIQYEPVELSPAAGRDLYFIKCIWVHGYKQGIGDFQNRGIGKALLAAAEDDIRSMNKKGAAAWGLALPVWMKAAWFKKQGYRNVDRRGLSVLLWKPFSEEARPPRWIRPKKKPEREAGKVSVAAFINGWCPAQNLVYERAKRAALEFGDRVEFREYATSGREVFLEWGISDGLFIDGRPLRTGPPPSFAKIRRKIGRRIKRLNP
jgi:GNAT superfamily N-acetyltransferase